MAGMWLPHLDIMWYDLKKTMNMNLFLQAIIFIINFLVTFHEKLACFV